MTVGRASLLHSAAGIPFVEALLAHARGDGISAFNAIDAFASGAMRLEHTLDDATLGVASLLAGCAALADCVTQEWCMRFGRDASQLYATGDALASRILATVGGWGPIGSGRGTSLYGFAHGWAGMLHSVLRWHEATARPSPAVLHERLDELAGCGLPTTDGICWPVRGRDPILSGRFFVHGNARAA